MIFQFNVYIESGTRRSCIRSLEFSVTCDEEEPAISPVMLVVSCEAGKGSRCLKCWAGGGEGKGRVGARVSGNRVMGKSEDKVDVCGEVEQWRCWGGETWRSWGGDLEVIKRRDLEVSGRSNLEVLR